VALLVSAAPVAAQGMSTGGSKSSSSSGGGLLGSLGGSSSGSALGGSSSSGGLAGLGGSSTSGGLAGLGGTSTGGGSFGSTSGGYSGTTGGGGGGFRGGSGSSGQAYSLPPSNLDPFAGNYYNPLAQGRSIASTTSLLGTSNTSVSSFGNPTFGTQTTTNVTAKGAAAASTQNGQAAGFTTVGTVRSPAFQTVLGESMPAPSMTRALDLARSDLARSSVVSRGGNVQVALNGDTFVLTGEVATARDRTMAEALVRYAPGVVNVRNDLVVRK
jgi:hypothetical protein